MLTNSCVDVHSLGRNALGAAGATAVAEALKVNRVITKLDLYGNGIGPDGAKALAEALRVNAVLTTIECASHAQIRNPCLGMCIHTFSTLARFC